MACEACIKAGKQKFTHYEKNGRWETRIYCKHTYTRAALDQKELRHVISKHQAARTHTKTIKRKSRGPRLDYTREMDQYILLHYSTKRLRGHHVMIQLAKAFGEQFGIRNVRPNQIIGRWTRLMKDEQGRILNQARGTPSLPVLKFMQSEV